MYIQRRRKPIRANDDIDVNVPEEASDLLFEAEDVAELVAEVTGQDVDVAVDDDAVTFSVGDEDFTVEADGDEEVLEASTRVRGTRPVAASQKRVARRPIKASAQRQAPAKKPATTTRRIVRK